MSIDHMDGSVFGTGSPPTLLGFANLRSREYGSSTSAERTAVSSYQIEPHSDECEQVSVKVGFGGLAEGSLISVQVRAGQVGTES
jgi:hypothetical protein